MSNVICKYFMFRRKTTTQQKDPSLLIDKLVSYATHIHRMMKLHAFSDSKIYAINETHVWLDMVSSTTVSKVGARDVPLKTSNHEKICVSVCIALKGDCTNLKLFIALLVQSEGRKY